VVITISTGPATAAVPDVIGKSESEAKSTLTGAGFKVAVVYEVHSSSGTVLGQDPSSNTQVKIGSTVTIIVDGSPTPAP